MLFSKKIKKFKKDWNSLKNWPKVPRRWTKIKKVSQISFLIVGLAITFIPPIFQQYSLIKVYEGLKIPNGPSQIYLNFTDASNVQFNLPYSIENKGFYNLLDFNLEVSLKLKYTNKNTGIISQRVILSENSGFKNIYIGNTFNDIFYKDYLSFDWENIGKYNDEVDTLEDVTVLMGFKISFYLEGIERDQISFVDMDLSSVPTELSSSSLIRINNELNSDLIYNHVNYFKLYFYIFTIISLVAFSYFLSLGFLRSRKNKKKINITKNLRINRFKKEPIYKKNLKNSLIKVVIYTSIVIIWDLLLIFSQFNANLEGFTTGDYTTRYMIAIVVSIILLLSINVISLLPAIKPEKFVRYSFKKGSLSLLISILSTLNILFWAITAIIVYKFGEVAIIVRDTFPSFIPIIIILIFYILVKITDLIIIKKYDKHFHTIRNNELKESMTKRKADQRKPKNKGELNILIFKAIKFFNKDATWSNIKRYFRMNKKGKVTQKGEKLNKQYLEALINQLYLVKRVEDSDESDEKQDINKKEIYHLTPLASNLLKEIENNTYVEITINENQLIQCPHCNNLSLFTNGRCSICENFI